MKPTPPPRLSMLQAPRADVAVIFRRGPAKWTEVVRWDTHRDHFERGAWFRGRIYDDRSDLSPDGELLIYFASQFRPESTRDKGYTNIWTAISRPPWLTALALWPKNDTYAGGGLFLTKRQVWLNHTPEDAEPHPRHKPHGVRVETNTGSIYTRRLDRDGWRVEQEIDARWLANAHRWRTIRPGIRVRHYRDHALRVMMRWSDALLSFAIEGPSGVVALPQGRIDWVDWDPRGRLVALVDGTVRVAKVNGDAVEEWTLLLDLRDDKPEARRSPDSARVW